jgi:hypothetical protein
MKQLLTLILICFSFYSSSQYSFEWGTPVKTRSYIMDIFNQHGNSFKASTFRGFSQYRIATYKDLKFISETQFECLVDGKENNQLEGICEIDSKILIFTSKDNEDRTSKILYVHEFKDSGSKVQIEGKKIASFDYDKQNKRRTGYTLIISEDKQKLGVTYYSAPKKQKDNEKGKYGYFIMNTDLEIENEGTFDDVLDEAGESIVEYRISNQGSLFLVTSVSKKDEPSTMKFYKVTENNINSLELNIGDKYINQISIAIDKKENFVVSGFYGTRAIKGQTRGTGVRGVFFSVIDPKSEKIINSGFNEFDDDFILMGATEKQKERAEKRKEKKGIEPSLYNFKMRYFEKMDDGESFGVAEEYYYTVHTSTDPKTGATSTTYTYYYNDLIAFKLDKNGEMIWKKRIQKSQISRNDNGRLSSFTMKVLKDKAYIIFNDNLKNYDVNTKKYLDNGDVYPMTFSKKNNAIAICELDLKDGEVSRKFLSTKNELGATLIPRLCVPDRENPSILLYTRNKKAEIVGRIKFD